MKTRGIPTPQTLLFSPQFFMGVVFKGYQSIRQRIAKYNKRNIKLYEYQIHVPTCSFIRAQDFTI